MKEGYKPTNAGQQVVKAPNQQKGTSGNTVVKGTDLRTGKRG